MSVKDGESEFIKVAKNEYLLFLFRFCISACSLLMTWFILDIKSDTKDVKKEFADYRITQEARIAKLEGMLGVFDTSIRMHSTTLDSHERRIYDLTRAYGNGPMSPIRPIP